MFTALRRDAVDGTIKLKSVEDFRCDPRVRARTGTRIDLAFAIYAAIPQALPLRKSRQRSGREIFRIKAPINGRLTTSNERSTRRLRPQNGVAAAEKENQNPHGQEYRRRGDSGAGISDDR